MTDKQTVDFVDWMEVQRYEVDRAIEADEIYWIKKSFKSEFPCGTTAQILNIYKRLYSIK